jgi:hypothetical protein
MWLRIYLHLVFCHQDIFHNIVLATLRLKIRPTKRIMSLSTTSTRKPQLMWHLNTPNTLTSSSLLDQGRTKRSASRAEGARRCHWNNLKYVDGASKLRFPHANFYLQFGHAPSKRFANPVLGRKRLRISVWGGAKLLACPGRPNISGRSCTGQRFGLRRAHQHMLCDLPRENKELLRTH